MNTTLETLNGLGQAFVEASTVMLVQASVLITLLGLINWALRKHVRGVIRYWIWTLVLVKLVLPPSLISPLGLGQWIPNVKEWLSVTISPTTDQKVETRPIVTTIESLESPASDDVGPAGFVSSPTMHPASTLDHPTSPLATPELVRQHTVSDYLLSRVIMRLTYVVKVTCAWPVVRQRFPKICKRNLRGWSFLIRHLWSRYQRIKIDSVGDEK